MHYFCILIKDERLSKLLLLLLLLLATMTLNQVQSFRINHQAGNHYINI